MSGFDWDKWYDRVDGRDTTFDEYRDQKRYMATVAATHVSGGAILFGSDHKHAGFVRLRINTAYRSRRHGAEYVYSDKELIEVNMSEAQWARMISSMNFGSGTPATINHILHDRPEQPVIEDSKEKAKKDYTDVFDDAMKILDKLATTKLTKDQKAMVAKAKQEIQSNAPFMAEQFDEYMENRVERAKIDIEAYATANVFVAGVDALTKAVQADNMIENKER